MFEWFGNFNLGKLAKVLLKKNWLTYGSLMGVLMIVLQITHYKAFIKDIRIEFFGVIIGILFMSLGIWLGISWYKKKTIIDKFDPSKLGLSNREVEVLEYLSQGFSNQEIADKLFVSLNTIKTHIAKIYQKLNVNRRTQAVQKAREMALITPHREN